MRRLEEIARRHEKVAFLIGNGPNRASEILPDWKQLLASISSQVFLADLEGLSNTEVYDMIELQATDSSRVKKAITRKLRIPSNANLSKHQSLMQLARAIDAPVLTTNFDEAFEKSIRAERKHITTSGFTRFYPWKSYYGNRQHRFPTDGFGIWKIHGDVNYRSSIRLGLTDYMGSAERARKLIHNGDDSLFRGKNRDYWNGHQTWLHIWFNLPLIIVGFGYDIDEVFLRWLLIERKRYYKLIDRPMQVYFIDRDQSNPRVHNFMRNLEVELVLIDNFNEIYV